MQPVETTSSQMSQVCENGWSGGKKRMGCMCCQALQSRTTLSRLFHSVKI